MRRSKKKHTNKQNNKIYRKSRDEVTRRVREPIRSVRRDFTIKIGELHDKYKRDDKRIEEPRRRVFHFELPHYSLQYKTQLQRPASYQRHRTVFEGKTDIANSVIKPVQYVFEHRIGELRRVICQRRAERRRVLFARNIAGNGSIRLKKPEFTEYSKIHCEVK